ncbi:hypothetical protein Hz2V006 [Helicoverpa zea nudivirus 2]|uniref:Uncharacterized protein n=1 Tax=Helicoverpa zea nudivirus 2 TaxID=1128424 RepID=G9I032_HZNV2|nr:orf6 gene product [Helicoverpa zea nudivirus 2]AEW69555.1 hypothetical protein Hz2V006 [Helicoverpa zea nudivirus 2]
MGQRGVFGLSSAKQGPLYCTTNILTMLVEPKPESEATRTKVFNSKQSTTIYNNLKQSNTTINNNATTKPLEKNQPLILNPTSRPHYTNQSLNQEP